MYGVVSILDSKHYQQIEVLWKEMAERFGLRNSAESPFPHFSYHVADHYHLAELETVLARFARNSGGFRVKTSGLGLFTSARPVLYVPVVRNTDLNRLHRELWPALSRTATGVSGYYHPENWLPHITLIDNGLDLERLAAAIRWLAGEDFTWEIPVDNLALLRTTGQGYELLMRFEW